MALSIVRRCHRRLPLITEFVKERGAGDIVIPFSCQFEQAVCVALATVSPRLDPSVMDDGVLPRVPLMLCVQVSAVESGGPDAITKLETELGAKSCLPRIIRCGFKILNLINFFTAGEDEVRAWTIRVSSRARCIPAARCLILSSSSSSPH